MGLEIERKFLVNPIKFLLFLSESNPTPRYAIRQGYLHLEKPEVRVRIKEALSHTDQAVCTITVKGAGTLERQEDEAVIDSRAAYSMYSNCQWKIEKVRYEVMWRSIKWEVDVFKGRFEGLVMAEVELPNKEGTYTPPPFLLGEVTENPNYKNAMLAKLNQIPKGDE